MNDFVDDAIKKTVSSQLWRPSLVGQTVCLQKERFVTLDDYDRCCRDLGERRQSFANERIIAGSKAVSLSRAADCPKAENGENRSAVTMSVINIGLIISFIRQKKAKSQNRATKLTG